MREISLPHHGIPLSPGSVSNRSHSIWSLNVDFFSLLRLSSLFRSILVFIELLQHCFCFIFWIFCYKAPGILVLPPGTEPKYPALEGKVLTTGPPGKSLDCPFSVKGLWPWRGSHFPAEAARQARLAPSLHSYLSPWSMFCLDLTAHRKW